MAQIFHPGMNALSRLTVYGAVLLIGLLAWAWYELYNSDYVTGVDFPSAQPVQFSHKHHVADDGIDCRYCHTTVETGAFAGMPSTETCMTCHSQIWADSPMLAPVRDSFQNGAPILWTRVYRVPDFVFFDHSIHIYKGIGCSTCHGQVDQMPLTWRAASLYMGWCLDCHNAPERYVRPRDQVFNMNWTAPADQLQLGQKLVKEYKIQKLTDCYTCHR
jgi:hypothetical protein